MLRERHDTPPIVNPGKWGDFHLTYVPDSFPRIRGSVRPVEGGDAGLAGEGVGRPSPASLAGGSALSPKRRGIESMACSAYRQPTGRSPNASWVAAAEAGRRPDARTPTSRSR